MFVLLHVTMMLQVLVCEKLAPLKEYYFAIIMDRAHKVIIIILMNVCVSC